MIDLTKPSDKFNVKTMLDAWKTFVSQFKKMINKITEVIKPLWKQIWNVVKNTEKMKQFKLHNKILKRTKNNRIKKKQQKRIQYMVFNI